MLQQLREVMGAVNVKWTTPEQGAATSVLLATPPRLEGICGRYFEDCNEGGPNQPESNRGVAPHAVDPEAAETLLRVSLESIGS